MKYLFITLSIVIFFFNGCSNFPKPSSITGLEGKNVSTYLRGSHIDFAEVLDRLRESGFKVIGTYKPVKKGRTIIFTNEELKKEAIKTDIAQISILRMFIDDKNKSITFTNPIYFAKAFMGDKYNHELFYKQLQKIKKAFPDLVDSKDSMNFDKLANYNFMVGMPSYADVIYLANGDTKVLLEKAKTYKKGKRLIFELKLSEDSYLLGYDLGKRTKRFVKKIGRENGTVLPYTMLIQNGKASSLDAKYYLALSYPQLTMTEFTTIATVPGAIKKDLSKPFKK